MVQVQFEANSAKHYDECTNSCTDLKPRTQMGIRWHLSFSFLKLMTENITLYKPSDTVQLDQYYCIAHSID